MKNEEIIKKWQLLLDNYKLLDAFLGDMIGSLAPDKELLIATIKALKEQEHVNADKS